MSQSKIDKLTREIEKKKASIEGYEGKLHEAREMHKSGRIDKVQLSKAKAKYQQKIREARSVIHRKEKARLHFEKDLKEKREKKEKKGK